MKKILFILVTASLSAASSWAQVTTVEVSAHDAFKRLSHVLDKVSLIDENGVRQSKKYYGSTSSCLVDIDFSQLQLSNRLSVRMAGHDNDSGINFQVNDPALSTSTYRYSEANGVTTFYHDVTNANSRKHPGTYSQYYEFSVKVLNKRFIELRMKFKANGYISVDFPCKLKTR